MKNISPSPTNPYDVILPEKRWTPASETILQPADRLKLLPPLVPKIRSKIKIWRDKGYPNIAHSSKALLNYWFNREHYINNHRFRFYFAQREAIETIIYLYEVAKAYTKEDLIKYDQTGLVTPEMFDENWPRYVIKMATGTGKTNVITLAILWAYFHKYYEPTSPLSNNFLIIAPNIIVLNRLLKDFEWRKIFKTNPFIPPDNFEGRNWQRDFSLAVHIQDNLQPLTETGNLFISNVHRIYETKGGDQTSEEMFFGSRPKDDSDMARGMDLGRILRSNTIKDLIIFNDEAHHVHDEDLVWFKSIETIHNKFRIKYQTGLNLQIDFSATPRHRKGEVFAQTVSDYPLVEAIRHNIVKSPVLPDEASRAKLTEHDSPNIAERYKDYIHLGYIEWKKQFDALSPQKKTPILFIMTQNTQEADATATFIEEHYPLLENAVLTIHTNNNGIINERTPSKRSEEELQYLRYAANNIDSEHSQYKVIVSVLMLREGWDVRNVTTIVGLRAFNSPAKILPEQAIGRGLRKMFPLHNVPEELVVVGTRYFIEFVEDLKREGVEFQYSTLGKEGAPARIPLIVAVDKKKSEKDLTRLNIDLPKMKPRFVKNFKKLHDLDVNAIPHQKIPLKHFPPHELKAILFEDLEENFSHKTIFTAATPHYESVLSFLTYSIMRDTRLLGGFDILCPKVDDFIRNRLFTTKVPALDAQIVRNLSEPHTKNTLKNVFRKAILNLIITDQGASLAQNTISLRKTPPKYYAHYKRKYVLANPKKSIFNRIVLDNLFEYTIGEVFEKRFAHDFIAFAKNTRDAGGVNFCIEYQAETGDLKNYYPDFFVKYTKTDICIIEAKGREDLDDIRKYNRLYTWCQDMNSIQTTYTYIPLYIQEREWDKVNATLRSFKDLIDLFRITKRRLLYYETD